MTILRELAMYDYILGIAGDLFRIRPDADIDEIAALAGVKSTHIAGYFSDIDQVRGALADELAASGPLA
ncbi:MAG: hypothetical protein J2P17_21450 [Mycobacterium sp.]|nr:hypothetical protein [Mycobacterium sp.]